jgi:glycosyltransferase involved in cell wall biosynthesis
MRAFAKPPPSKAITDRRVRVLLVLGALDGGGAERVAVNILQGCDPDRVDIRLGLLRRAGPYLSQVDNASIAVARDIVGMVREARPDVLMSFGMGINLMVALAMLRLGHRRPVWICREDSNMEAEITNLTGSRMGRWVVGGVVGRAYRSADALVSVSADLARRLERRLGIKAGAIHAIHNPAEISRIMAAAAEPLPYPPRRPFIVTAGRLTRQKGQDMLIAAFAASAAARDLDLVILGEGPLEAELRAQAAALGVGDRVLFPGFQANPWAWFAHARLFVLASRWEGFGNVITEAMACGAPVLSSDCDFGPREQIAHGETGWLVAPNNIAALTNGFDGLLVDSRLLDRLARAGRQRAMSFDVGPIAASYTARFVGLAHGTGC